MNQGLDDVISSHFYCYKKWVWRSSWCRAVKTTALVVTPIHPQGQLNN